MKKRLLSIILMLVLIPTIALAGTASEEIKVQKNVSTITVNGEKITADNFIYNGTTYVPLRAVSENMGSEVSWDNNTKTAAINTKADDVYLYFNLYKRSTATKDMANAIAIHFLTSTNDLTTLKNVQTYARELTDMLNKSEIVYKNHGGDMYKAYQLIKINATHLNAVIDASIQYGVTSTSANADTALDNCETILDECDANNEYISTLTLESYTQQ